MKDILPNDHSLIIAELKASNAELKRANGDLQASNKELTQRNEILARLVLDLQETVNTT